MFTADNESLIMLRIFKHVQNALKKKQVQVFPWAPRVRGGLWPQLFGHGGPPLSGNASYIRYRGRWNKFLVPPFPARPCVQVNLAMIRQGRARPRVVTFFFFGLFCLASEAWLSVSVLPSVFLPARARPLSIPQILARRRKHCLSISGSGRRCCFLE